MNKKIIALITGILLILAGLIGWYFINKDNNIDEQVLEDVKLNEEVSETDTVKNDNLIIEQETKIIKTNVPSKAEPPRPRTKVIINLPEPEIKETPMFKEAVSEEKELTNPYVDSDGSIVVTDEIRQPIKQKVKYRGVVYNIKTKLLAPQK